MAQPGTPDTAALAETPAPAQPQSQQSQQPAPPQRLRRGIHRLSWDDDELLIRRGMSTATVAWADVRGFEVYVDADCRTGILVAQTLDGLIELAATRRGVHELDRLHARMEAHRLRVSG